MFFTLEVLPAQEGDCLLLHWGTQAKPRLAVIDGGPGRVYENTLKPRLEAIAAKRNAAPLPIDLVMVSHVDNDHIVGIKKLFRDLKKDIEDETADEDRSFKVERLWHNTFNDVLGDSIDKYYKTLTASVTASVDGGPNPKIVDAVKKNLEQKGETEDEAVHVAHDIGLILAGHGESRELRDNHGVLREAHDIAVINHPFEKNGKPTLITAEMTPTPVKLDGLSFKIVGPLEAQIKALQVEFDAFITARGLTAEAMLAAYSDTRAPNLSSIVALVTMNGKKILLTGDARGDFVLTGLTKAGLLSPPPLKVDILKVPHHGSDHNLEIDFFEKIIADTYVFSADGRFGNPDRTSVEMLIEARGKNARYDIVIPYKVAAVDTKRKSESRKPWKPADHALAKLFAARAADGFKFKVREGKAHKIELGDAIPW